MDDRRARGWGAPAVGAISWCAAFAAVHLFWAAGGSVGLASSAGRHLAQQRPASFVIVGLLGVALLLLIGIALIMTATGRRGRRLSRPAIPVITAVGVLLLIRGVALEILLAVDAGGLRTTIGPLETRWSLVLWNPWFALGGALFLWAAIRAWRSPAGRGDSGADQVRRP